MKKYPTPIVIERNELDIDRIADAMIHLLEEMKRSIDQRKETA
ncbi:hypothetical protein [Baia soyae]|uniref:Uncharacterized protein n=1 Tax=Baia soyae TaxID=1544746 RepID=A0A4R2RV51_9BACL|nr:hypothetical protein [Baia soyae]TCP68270.1 hypothetical protein EDD57_1188 [Baia soyae]